MGDKLPKKALPFLWHFILKNKKAYFSCAFFIVCASVFGVLVNYSNKLIIDYLGEFSQGVTFGVVFAGGVALFLAFVFTHFFREASHRIASIFLNIYGKPYLLKQIRLSLLGYVSKHSYDYFTNNFAGSISYRINNISNKLNSLSSQIVYHLNYSLLTFIFALIVTYMSYPVLSLVMLVWIVVYVGGVSFYLKKTKKKAEDWATCKSNTGGVLVDIVNNILNVKFFGNYKKEKSNFSKSIDFEVKHNKDYFWLIEKVRIGQVILQATFISSIVLISIYFWTKGQITIGDIVMIMGLAGSVQGHAWGFVERLIKITEDKNEINEGLNVLLKEYSVKNVPNAKKLKIKNGKIEFSDVLFKYPETNKNLFENLNLLIKPNEKVAFVGESGSGKSTLLNLLLRSYDLDSGKILIDGKDISRYKQESIGDDLAIVSQEPLLFNRTILENVKYGNNSATKKQVIDACIKANIYDFIKSLPKGFDTLVGERGMKLSGGQRQRIVIARAILKDPKILILDEATSSLDVESEKNIQKAIDNAVRRKTVIAVAHRLVTVINFDRIFVLHQGEIIGVGNHKELLKSCPYYKGLWDIQSGK